MYLPSNQSLGDLLCIEEHATRPSLMELDQHCRIPDGHSASDDDDTQQPFYAPAACVDLPQRQVVVVETNHSSWLQLNGAMPQGSWLGPLTFLLLIDDLQADCLIHKYVDDTSTTLTELLQGRVVSSNMQAFFSSVIKVVQNQRHDCQLH